MRPRILVARTALTAALALVALPGLAGSTIPSTSEAIDAAAFQAVIVDPATREAALQPLSLDPAYRSAGHVTAQATLVEPGIDLAAGPGVRPETRQPATAAASEMKSPKYTLRGEATFYDHGTTAMRLPRGTRVVICGDGGCIERVVSDYGPVKKSRIVDLYRPDFFAICGCPWYAGVVNVTVHVY